KVNATNIGFGVVGMVISCLLWHASLLRGFNMMHLMLYLRLLLMGKYLGMLHDLMAAIVCGFKTCRGCSCSTSGGRGELVHLEVLASVWGVEDVGSCISMIGLSNGAAWYMSYSLGLIYMEVRCEGYLKDAAEKYIAWSMLIINVKELTHAL
nr:hypothetical protein [Tanacetum cinerariifolium]